MSDLQVPLQLVVDEFRKQIDDLNYHLTVTRIAMKNLQADNDSLKIENENLRQLPEF